MLVQVRNRCSEFDSYRAARVKSLFNAESGANFTLDADLPIEDDDWRIAVIVGPSGSGKSSLGRLVFGEAEVYREPEWPAEAHYRCHRAREGLQRRYRRPCRRRPRRCTGLA